MYKEASAGRYGENPFPYGENYDLGISLESVVGTLDGPQELIIDREYVAIILHDSLGSVLKGASGMVNVVYVPRDNMPGGDASRTVAIRKTVSGIMGVVDDASRVLAVFPITRDGTVNNDTTVFENVLTAQNYNATIIEGLTAGTPLYYFSWDPVDKKLDSPVKRCFYEPEEASPELVGVRFGIFLPETSPGNYGTPIPAIYSSSDVGFNVSLQTMLSLANPVQDRSLTLGKIDLSAGFAVVPGINGQNIMVHHNSGASGSAAYGFKFYLSTMFPNVTSNGIFYPKWFAAGTSPEDPTQNPEGVYIDNHDYIYNMSAEIGFVPGTDSRLFYVVGSTSSYEANGAEVAANMDVAISPNEIAGGTTDTGTGLEHIFGSLYMCSAFIDYRGRYTIQGGLVSVLNVLGTELAYLAYNNLPDGTQHGEVLTWNDNGKYWMPLLPEQGHMPPGEDQNTMFYDEEATPEGGGEGGEEGGGEGGDGGEGGEEEQKGAWVANKVLLWQKGKAVSGENKGNRLLFDFESLMTRPWDADMPGIAFKHPTGATSGLFANIESGANAGDRLDMGFGGDGGGNFEIYGNDHNTRSGQFRIIVGEEGHVEIKVHQGGTSWKTVAGISKHGRFFCGFNDTGFPGGNETYGTYPAPQHPLQVYDEEEHDSQVVAHITKDGVLKLRAEIGEIERDVTIDLSDISEENEEAISVKLRETYVLEMEDGKLVGKKRMILCSESYGDAEEVGSANIEDGTTGQILRWTDGEWKPTSLVEQNVVTDAEYAAGEFSITTEKLECLVKSGGNATKTVFNTVEGAGKMNTGTTVGHTHD